MVARSTRPLSYVKGRRMRLTRLDGCGRPVYGDASTVVTKGFISVGYTANTNETDATNVTNAAGETIVFEPSVASFAGFGVEIAFGVVDPDAFALITGQSTVLDAEGRVIGFDVDTAVELDNSGFALEVWCGAPTGDACAPGSAASQGQFGYILLPFVQGGILGDFTVENGAVTFTISGANTRSGGSWGRGPYDVLTQPDGTVGPMLTPVKSTVAMRSMIVDVAPPAAFDGARPLFDGSQTPLTSASATVTGNSAELSVVPDAADDEAIFWDFGDGTWDYVLGDGGTTIHEYDEPGTYEVAAFNGGGKPVKASVVIA